MIKDQALLYNSEQGKFYVAVDARGAPILVEGFLAVAQQLMMMIIVELGSYAPDPNLGTNFQQIIGVGGAQSPYIAFLYRQIEDAVDKLITVQESFSQLIELEDTEIIEGFEGLDIVEDPSDPRIVNLTVTVQTRDGLNQNLSIPLNAR